MDARGRSASRTHEENDDGRSSEAILEQDALRQIESDLLLVEEAMLRRRGSLAEIDRKIVELHGPARPLTGLPAAPAAPAGAASAAGSACLVRSISRAKVLGTSVVNHHLHPSPSGEPVAYTGVPRSLSPSVMPRSMNSSTRASSRSSSPHPASGHASTVLGCVNYEEWLKEHNDFCRTIEQAKRDQTNQDYVWQQRCQLMQKQLLSFQGPSAASSSVAPTLPASSPGSSFHFQNMEPQRFVSLKFQTAVEARPESPLRTPAVLLSNVSSRAQSMEPQRFCSVKPGAGAEALQIACSRSQSVEPQRVSSFAACRSTMSTSTSPQRLVARTLSAPAQPRRASRGPLQQPSPAAVLSSISQPNSANEMSSTSTRSALRSTSPARTMLASVTSSAIPAHYQSGDLARSALRSPLPDASRAPLPQPSPDAVLSSISQPKLANEMSSTHSRHSVERSPLVTAARSALQCTSAARAAMPASVASSAMPVLPSSVVPVGLQTPHSPQHIGASRSLWTSFVSTPERPTPSLSSSLLDTPPTLRTPSAHRQASAATWHSSDGSKPNLSAPTYISSRQTASGTPVHFARSPALVERELSLEAHRARPWLTPASGIAPNNYMQEFVATQVTRGRSPSPMPREAALPPMPMQQAQPLSRAYSPAQVVEGPFVSLAQTAMQHAPLPSNVPAVRDSGEDYGFISTLPSLPMQRTNAIGSAPAYPQSFTQVELGSFAEGLEQWKPSLSMKSANSFQPARAAHEATAANSFAASGTQQRQSFGGAPGGFQPLPKGKTQCPVQ